MDHNFRNSGLHPQLVYNRPSCTFHQKWKDWHIRKYSFLKDRVGVVDLSYNPSSEMKFRKCYKRKRYKKKTNIDRKIVKTLRKNCRFSLFEVHEKKGLYHCYSLKIRIVLFFYRREEKKNSHFHFIFEKKKIHASFVWHHIIYFTNGFH